MGSGFTGVCKKCDIKTDFYFGSGMQGIFSPNRIYLLDEKQQERFQNQLNGKDIVDEFFYHEMFQCNCCNKLINKPYLRTTTSDGTFFETTYDCEDCQTPMSVIERTNIDDIPCPQCNSSFDDISHFRWD